jgi:hypothetical protein
LLLWTIKVQDREQFGQTSPSLAITFIFTP